MLFAVPAIQIFPVTGAVKIAQYGADLVRDLGGHAPDGGEVLAVVVEKTAAVGRAVHRPANACPAAAIAANPTTAPAR